MPLIKLSVAAAVQSASRGSASVNPLGRPTYSR